MKKIIVTLLLGVIVVNPLATANAQNVRSNTVITKVGDPADPPPVIGSGSCPSSGDIKTTILELYKIRVDGSWNEEHLQMMCDKFAQLATSTKFLELIKDGELIRLAPPCAVLDPGSCVPNQMAGHVEMFQTGKYAQQDEFLGTLTHELGHTIYNGQPLSLSMKGRHDIIFGQVGTFSTYSRAAGSASENYAEVIAYCLNKKAVGSVNEAKFNQYYLQLAIQILGACV